MQQFQRILMVSHGLGDEHAALKEAVTLARKNSAELSALIVAPELPPSMEDYRERFANSLRDRFREELGTVIASLAAETSLAAVPLEVEFGATPAVRIIRHALRNSIDLIIKTVESADTRKGLSAVDLNLLRKSPVPVWLTRPLQTHQGSMRIGVAIDPVSPNPAAHALSVRLLRVARQLSAADELPLEVVSCWDYEYESYLRGNPWMRMTDEEIDAAVRDAEQRHRTALDDLLREAGIGGNLRVSRIRGKPSEKIPEFVDANGIDVLVMGTVARTGLRSFVMGNTAEAILQSLGCSLVAFKPEGFVSPVTGDD
jgi:nucleotide-binding universal stress UspA family protein